jgi:hypothetical protein
MTNSTLGFYETIRHLDSYFVKCSELGQGISGRESAEMREAVEELIKIKGVGVVLDLSSELKSNTSQSNLRRALNNVHPNFSKLFV